MTTRDIKKMALLSFKNENLDEQIVLKIAKMLSKKDLRQYIKTLRLIDRKKTVVVSIANKTNVSLQAKLTKIFKDKKIIIKEDKNLIAGIKIEDFDNVYEFNLKNTLENIVNFVNQ